MAINAIAVHECRTTGSDLNGGFYTAGGTDYSQQDAAQLSIADAVTNGTTAITSATAGFTAAMIGNGINIVGDGVYEITSYTNASTIGVERATGTSAGSAAKVGGAFATPGYACGKMVSRNTLYIKAGTYSITSATVNIAGGCLTPPSGSKSLGYTFVAGYNAARGDSGTMPILRASGLGTATIVEGTGVSYFRVRNVTVDGNGLSNIYAFSSNGGNPRFDTCKAMGCAGSNGIGFLLDNDASSILCEASACGYGFNTQQPYNQVSYGYAHGCSVTGFYGGGTFTRCIAASATGTGDGFQLTQGGGGGVYDCLAYANARHGFSGLSTGSTHRMVNDLAYGNGGWGFTQAAVNYACILYNCAGGSNTSGNVNATNIPTPTVGFVTLTANPFIAAGTNFGLNTTAGGGAALRAAGFPGAWPGLASTVGYGDIGPVQHADAASGGGVMVAGWQGGYSG